MRGIDGVYDKLEEIRVLLEHITFNTYVATLPEKERKSEIRNRDYQQKREIIINSYKLDNDNVEPTEEEIRKELEMVFPSLFDKD